MCIVSSPYVKTIQLTHIQWFTIFILSELYSTLNLPFVPSLNICEDVFAVFILATEEDLKFNKIIQMITLFYCWPEIWSLVALLHSVKLITVVNQLSI